MARTSETKYIKLFGTHLRETPLAVHFNVAAVNTQDNQVDSQSHWFPISQIKSVTHTSGTEGLDIIEVAEWIVRSKELI